VEGQRKDIVCTATHAGVALHAPQDANIATIASVAFSAKLAIRGSIMHKIFAFFIILLILAPVNAQHFRGLNFEDVGYIINENATVPLGNGEVVIKRGESVTFIRISVENETIGAAISKAVYRDSRSGEDKTVDNVTLFKYNVREYFPALKKSKPITGNIPPFLVMKDELPPEGDGLYKFHLNTSGDGYKSMAFVLFSPDSGLSERSEDGLLMYATDFVYSFGGKTWIKTGDKITEV